MKESVRDPRQARASGLNRLLRTLVAVHVLVLLAQSFFAGSFMDGRGRFLAYHQFTGTTIIVAVSVAQSIVAGICWRRRLQPAGFMIASIGLFLAESAQIGLGFQRQLALHVTLGVAIFGGALVLLHAIMKPARPGSAENPSLTKR